MQDYLDVGPGYGIEKVDTSEAWAGKTIGEIDLPTTCRLSVLAVARPDSVVLTPPPDEVLRPRDALIVAGLDEDLARLPDASQLPDRRRRRNRYRDRPASEDGDRVRH